MINFLDMADTAEKTDDFQSNFAHLSLYDVSYMWYGPITFLICIFVGLLVSLARPTDHRKLDKRLISPTASSLFFWIPNFSLFSNYKSLQFRTNLRNYYSQVGSQHASISKSSSNSDVFGKNGAINVAYMQTDPPASINTDSTYMWNYYKVSIWLCINPTKFTFNI